MSCRPSFLARIGHANGPNCVSSNHFVKNTRPLAKSTRSPTSHSYFYEMTHKFYLNKPAVQPSFFSKICKENLKFSRNPTFIVQQNLQRKPKVFINQPAILVLSYQFFRRTLGFQLSQTTIRSIR